MKIDIIIDRDATPDDKTKKTEKQIHQLLAITEFPVGIMHSHPSERDLHFSGTVHDFITAIEIKKRFLESGKSQADKQAMNKALAPIYEKSKALSCRTEDSKQ